MCDDTIVDDQLMLVRRTVMQEPLTREQVRARMDAIPDVLYDELI